MTMLASQITSLTVVYSIVYSGVNQRKHQSSASLAFVREIHRGPVNFPHKWPVTRKMFPFDDVIMDNQNTCILALPEMQKTDEKTDFSKPLSGLRRVYVAPGRWINTYMYNYGELIIVTKKYVVFQMQLVESFKVDIWLSTYDITPASSYKIAHLGLPLYCSLNVQRQSRRLAKRQLFRNPSPDSDAHMWLPCDEWTHTCTDMGN